MFDSQTEGHNLEIESYGVSQNAFGSINIVRICDYDYSGSVALVLNPKTGLVSPQYHLLFYDDFSTVPHLQANTVPENWAEIVKNSRFQSVDGFYDVTKTWFNGIPDPTVHLDIHADATS